MRACIIAAAWLWVGSALAQDAAPRVLTVRVERDARIPDGDSGQFPEGVDRQALLDAMVARPRHCGSEAAGEESIALPDPLADQRRKLEGARYARALANIIFTERDLPYAALKDAVRELGRLRVPVAKNALAAIYRHADVLADRLANPCKQTRTGKWRCAPDWPEETATIAANFAHGIRRAVLDAAAELGDADGRALLELALHSDVGALRRHAERQLASLRRTP